MTSELPPLAFSILAIQFLLVALGVGALAGQYASPKATGALPSWDKGGGLFALFALIVMACFFVVSGTAFLPFQVMIQRGAPVVVSMGKSQFYTAGILIASITTQIATPVAIFLLLKAFSPGYRFNFPNISKAKFLPWKLGYVSLGCFAVAGLASWVVAFLQKVLDRATGMELVWGKQEIVDILFANRGNLPLMSLAFITAVIGAPVWEELFFRGCVYRFFKGIQNRHLAAALTGALFALIHFDAVAFIPLAFFGTYLCYAYESTGDIRVPIMAHALFNLNSFLAMLLAPELNDLI